MLTEQLTGGDPVISSDVNLEAFSQAALGCMGTAALLAPAVLRGPKDVERALRAREALRAQGGAGGDAAALPLRDWLRDAAELAKGWRRPSGVELDRVFKGLDL